MDYKFPSIENHYKNISDVLGKPAYISEKIDGANFSVLVKPDGQIQFRSKNQAANHKDGFFLSAQRIAEKIFENTSPEYIYNKFDTVYYFEVFGRGVQRRINYDKHLNKCADYSVEGRGLALLDIYDTENGWWDFRGIKAWAETTRVFAAPSYISTEFSLQEMNQLLESKDIEGWVVNGIDSVEKQGRVFNTYGELVRTKIKTLEFTSYEKGSVTIAPDIKRSLPQELSHELSKLITMGRLHSVYSHGNTQLERKMSDMRFLPKIVLEDVEAEGHEFLKNYEGTDKLKVTSKLLPNLLKSFLLGA